MLGRGFARTKGINTRKLVSVLSRQAEKCLPVFCHGCVSLVLFTFNQRGLNFVIGIVYFESYGLDSFEPAWRSLFGLGDASGMTKS